MEMNVFYLLGSLLIGILYRVWIKWSSAVKLKRVVNWKLILIAAAGSLIANVILIIYRQYLVDLLPVTILTTLLYGYAGDSILRGWLKKGHPSFSK